MENIFDNPIIGGGLMLSVIGTLAYSLKQVPQSVWQKVRSRVWHTVRVYDYDDAFPVLEEWLYSNHRRSFREVEAKSRYDHNERKPDITLKREPSVFWLKIGGKTLVFSSEKMELKNAQSAAQAFSTSYRISGWLAIDHIKGFLKNILEEHHKNKSENQVDVFTNDQWGNWNKASTIRVKPFSAVVLSTDLKGSIINDLTAFKNNQQWYLSRAIPYRRQYILHGKPGTGKTSIALASALLLKADVYVLNIKDIQSDSCLQMAFSSIRQNAMLLIEDVDTFFTSRAHNDPTDNKITFSALLNCMDGAFYKEGLVCFLSTNHVEKLDPALLRPGRTDRVIEVPYPGQDEVESFIRNFYQQDIKVPPIIGVAMSAVQEACILHKNDPYEAIRYIISKNHI